MVVMSNPMDLNAVEDIEFASGYRIQPVLSKESEIAKALDYYYLGVKPQEKEDRAEEESSTDEKSTVEDDILAEIDIIPGKPADEQGEEAAEVSDEDLISNEDPNAPPPPTPSREEAIAAEEAYLESNPTAEGGASTGTESFSLKEIVQIQEPTEEPDEPVLSLDEVEIDYETAIEERRFLGDLIEELEDIDGLMHTAVMKQRRILKNLIILLIKKGYITTEEIQDFASSDISEESTH
jgi:type IV secretory pathway VirB10-like protein